MPTASDELGLLRRVAAATGLRIAEDAERLQSWSNEAWRCGDVIVRICYQGDPQRLVREAAIGAALPAELLYPRVLDAGFDGEISWMLVVRVEGVPLWERWKTLPTRDLRPLMRQVAEVMRGLHAWEPPGDVLALLRAHDFDAGPDVDAINGHDLLPLPSPRWQPLVDAALTAPFVDAGMVRAVAARLEELAVHDPFREDAPVLVHGDVNFSNLLVTDTVTAVLDYEWARLGPPDAELVSLVRSAGHWQAEPVDFPPVMPWLREDYPELFEHPQCEQRVWMTELAYTLRHLLVWPPTGPPETLDESHPVHTLPRLVDAPWRY